MKLLAESLSPIQCKDVVGEVLAQRQGFDLVDDWCQRWTVRGGAKWTEIVIGVWRVGLPNQRAVNSLVPVVLSLLSIRRKS